MKYFFTIFLFLAAAADSKGQAFDCTRFREGKFRFIDAKYGGLVNTERSRSYQTESNESLKLILRFRITWEDNCSFVLKLDKVIRNENRLEIPTSLTVNGKIISTSGNGYVQECTSSLIPTIHRVSVTKIN